MIIYETTFIEIHPPRSYFPNFWSAPSSFLNFLSAQGPAFMFKYFSARVFSFCPGTIKIGSYLCSRALQMWFHVYIKVPNKMSCPFQLEILIAVLRRLLGDMSWGASLDWTFKQNLVFFLPQLYMQDNIIKNLFRFYKSTSGVLSSKFVSFSKSNFVINMYITDFTFQVWGKATHNSLCSINPCRAENLSTDFVSRDV